MPSQQRDIAIQFHLSVEPSLEPGACFSEQVRTVSTDCARGGSMGEGLYTTLNAGYWFSQLAYEEVGELPRHVYLVLVREPSGPNGTSAHQDLSPPEDVRVLTKLLEMSEDGDDPLPVSKLEWLADRWVRDNPDLAAAGFEPRGMAP